MKKVLAWITALMLILCLPAAAEAPERSIDDIEGKVVVYYGATSELTTEIFYDIYGVRVADVLIVPTIVDAISAIRSGRADYMTVPQFVAEYYCRQDEAMGTFKSNHDMSVYMVTRAADEALLAALNEAIDAVAQQGVTLELFDGLKDITDDTGETAGDYTPDPDLETIRVGISGDLPPLDYVAADGTPRGFSITYMNKVAEQMGVNVEFISVTLDASLISLLSDKIDVFFWHAMPVANEQLSVTEAYIDSVGNWLYMK